MGRFVTISFEPVDFHRVFRIPCLGATESTLTGKIMPKQKEASLQRICRTDLTQQEKDTIWQVGNQGLCKNMLANIEWKCLMDLIKCKLMGASRASNIAIWMVDYMIGFSLGKAFVRMHTRISTYGLLYDITFYCIIP